MASAPASTQSSASATLVTPQILTHTGTGGTDTDGADADGADADGADADGADTDGADTDGADADGADAVGADTAGWGTDGAVTDEADTVKRLLVGSGWSVDLQQLFQGSDDLRGLDWLGDVRVCSELQSPLAIFVGPLGRDDHDGRVF